MMKDDLSFWLILQVSVRGTILGNRSCVLELHGQKLAAVRVSYWSAGYRGTGFWELWVPKSLSGIYQVAESAKLAR
jgi:hypothetical protein